MACIRDVSNLYISYIFTKTAWLYFSSERLQKSFKKANKEMLCGQNTITPGNARNIPNAFESNRITRINVAI